MTYNPKVVAARGIVIVGQGAFPNFNPVTSLSAKAIAIGENALASLPAASTGHSVAVGNEALRNATGDGNVAVGRAPLFDLTTGSSNIAVGSDAGFTLTTGNNNIAIGGDTLFGFTTQSFNIAIGIEAGVNPSFPGTANIFIGTSAAANGTLSNRNVAIGEAAGAGELGPGSASADNTLVGDSAGAFFNGNRNVAIGRKALSTEASEQATATNDNVAIGFRALGHPSSDNKTFGNVVAIGANALEQLESGNDNVAIGRLAGSLIVSSSNVTLVGHEAGRFNTGANNVAVGSGALGSVSPGGTGGANVAIGRSSLRAATSAQFNVSIGFESLLVATSHSQSVSIGYEALRAAVAGGNNVAIGYQALRTPDGPSNTVAIGNLALTLMNSGGPNVAVGSEAGRRVISGINNTFIGVGAGASASLGTLSGNNNILLGFDANPTTNSTDNEATIGNSSLNTIRFASAPEPSSAGTSGFRIVSAQAAAFTQFTVAHTSNASDQRYGRFYSNGVELGSIRQATGGGGPLVYATSSDYRLKEDVEPVVDGLDVVDLLRPVSFRFGGAEIRRTGFLAHELQAVIPEAVSGEKDAVDGDGKPVYQDVDYISLIPVLVAATKDLKAQLAQALARIEQLEGRLESA